MNRMVLDPWSDQFPGLSAAYRLKEAFLNVWTLENEDDAKEESRRRHSSLTPEERPQWAPATTAMSNWEEEIVASLGDGKGNANAVTESMNRQMKDLNRAARSMSFEIVRAKILFSVEQDEAQGKASAGNRPSQWETASPVGADLVPTPAL